LSSGIKKIPRLRNGLPSISSDMLKSKFLELIAGKGMGLFSSGDTLETIEKRLLEIEEEKPRRIHNLSENFSNSDDDYVEGLEIGWLDNEKALLQLKRQFILDRREGWKSRVIWNILVPIVVAVITAYIVGNAVAGNYTDPALSLRSGM